MLTSRREPIGTLRRIERNTVLTLLTLAALAMMWRPESPRLALGVLGGGALAGFAYWAIRGVADAIIGAAGRGAPGPTPGAGRGRRGGWALVKFFTRHVILAITAYGMIAGVGLDPLGMLLGVSAPSIAAAAEAVRALHVSRRHDP